MPFTASSQPDAAFKPTNVPTAETCYHPQLMTSERYSSELNPDQLIHVLCHDLQSSPRCLRQFLMLFEHSGGRAKLSTDAAKYLDRMEAALDRFDDKLETLLSLSKIIQGSGEIKMMDPGAIAEEIATTLGVNIQVKERLPDVQCDPKHLKALFTELIDNVLAHAGPDARVEFSYENNWYRFADNGPGVDPTIRDQVFMVFRPVSAPESRHQGMGLSKCHRLLEMMNGRIEMECPENGGTIFWIQVGETNCPSA